MANVDVLISELDQKLRSIHQEQALIAKTGKTGILQQPLLPEYIQITSTDVVISGVEYIVLDTLANYFSLYEDDRERQQILGAMAADLDDAAANDILASIQIIENVYPSIYQLGKEKLTLTKERAIAKITGVIPTPVVQRDSTPLPRSQPNPQPTPQPAPQPVAVTAPQSKSGLVMGLGIACAVLFGALISNSLNKPPTPTALTASNSAPVTEPSSQANSQTTTSPAQASIPLPTPASNISRDAAVDVVKQWIQYKRVLFAPPFDKSQGSNLLTGKAYINNIDRSSEPCTSSDGEGCLSSVDWLQRYNGQYSFGVQRVDSINRFEASGDNATIFVTVTEYRTLHQNGRSKSSGGTKQARYDLKYENGRVKISDYKVF